MKRSLIASLCLILLAACTSAPGDVPAETAPGITQTPASTATAQAPTVTSPPPTAITSVDIPNATVVYYDISGSTADELRAQLDKLGPVGFDGYRGDSTTKWLIRWDWPGYGSSSCDLTAVTVSYDIQVIFPRWIPPANATPDLIAKWANYVTALAAHEKGHVDYVAANYQSVKDAIKGSSCDTGEGSAQAALAPIRQHDVDYDAETDHGATQGARFP